MRNSVLFVAILLISFLIISNCPEVSAEDTSSVKHEVSIFEPVVNESDDKKADEISTLATNIPHDNTMERAADLSSTSEPMVTEISQELYQENVAGLESTPMEKVYQMFTPDEDKHLLYVGRPTCYYCRQLSPELKKLNQLFPVEYYNIDGSDFDDYAKNFLFEIVGIPGTPTLIRLENGKVISAWIGVGSVSDIYSFMFQDLEKNILARNLRDVQSS